MTETHCFGHVGIDILSRFRDEIANHSVQENRIEKDFWIVEPVLKVELTAVFRISVIYP